VAKRKSHSVRRKSRFSIPIAVVAGFFPLASDVYYLGLKQEKPLQATANILQHNLIGFNPWNAGKWDAQGFQHGLYPILMGFVLHILAGKLGLNRLLARSGIPLLRV